LIDVENFWRDFNAWLAKTSRSSLRAERSGLSCRQGGAVPMLARIAEEKAKALN
jgi:hypothetical protein